MMERRVTGTSSLPIDIMRIMELIPHRFPFLMIDRIVELALDEKAVGLKNVSINEPYFQGHFPGQPVLPGIVQLHLAVLVCRALYGFDDAPQEVKRLKFKMDSCHTRWIAAPCQPGSDDELPHSVYCDPPGTLP